MLYNLFKGRLFKFVNIDNRCLYIFIVVIIKNKKDEEKKERLVLEKFDILIKDKIMKKGECKVICSENNLVFK